MENQCLVSAPEIFLFQTSDHQLIANSLSTFSYIRLHNFLSRDCNEMRPHSDSVVVELDCIATTIHPRALLGRDEIGEERLGASLGKPRVDGQEPQKVADFIGDPSAELLRGVLKVANSYLTMMSMIFRDVYLHILT